jgi:SAM-dependent methyltransferase
VRQHIKDFAALAKTTLPIRGPIYEFGAFQVTDQIGFADLRPLFPGVDYVGCDMREGVGVDRVLDLHAIDLPGESVGTVLCFDTLEHVEDPRKALQELYRILEPEGIAVISSVMNFPIHDHPHDYWRFTPEAFRSILKPFSSSWVGVFGSDLFPHTVVGVGFKGEQPRLDELQMGHDRLRARDFWSAREIVIRITPPAVLPLISALYAVARSVRR